MRFQLTVATGLYSGTLRPGPGTWGSAAAVFCWYLLSRLFALTLFHQIAIALFLFILGLYATERVLAGIRSGELSCVGRVDDPGMVVIDEWVGVWITLLGVHHSQPLLIGAGFLLFRVFDILKPPPVAAFEKLPGAWGVMMDDVVAGLLGLVVVLGLQLLL